MAEVPSLSQEGARWGQGKAGELPLPLHLLSQAPCGGCQQGAPHTTAQLGFQAGWSGGSAEGTLH